MEMKQLMTALAIIIPLFLHHLPFTIADHTRAFSSSSTSFSLPLFAKKSPDRTIRRGTDGFLYLQHSLSTSAANITTPVGPVANDDRLHLMVTEVHFGTGSGRRKLLLELDATAPLTWIQCVPCHPVATQTGPLFNGELSPTFQHVDSSVCTPPFRPNPAIRRCEFTLSNRLGLLVQGLVSVDQYTRQDGLVFPRFIFGCAHETHNFRNLNTFAGTFAYRRFAVLQAMANSRLTRSSYCLFRETNRQGFLRFGTEADIPNKPHYQTTRILPANDDVHESAYYVSLAGVSVGERRLSGVRPEMFSRRKDGQGGSIINLGTSLTEMVEEVYHVVGEAVWSDLERYDAERVTEQAGYGFCIQATEAIKGRLPSLSLHFAEEEATLVISPKQLFLMMDNRQAGQQIACLAMVPGPRTIIGALQQVDTRFVYDLKDNKLSFAPESCIQDTVPVV